MNSPTLGEDRKAIFRNSVNSASYKLGLPAGGLNDSYTSISVPMATIPKWNFQIFISGTTFFKAGVDLLKGQLTLLRRVMRLLHSIPIFAVLPVARPDSRCRQSQRSSATYPGTLCFSISSKG